MHCMPTVSGWSTISSAMPLSWWRSGRRVRSAGRGARATLRPMLVDIQPQQECTIERDGVRIAFQVFGDGLRSLLLLPTWSIVHSDFWRTQVPHLMSRYQLNTFDGRGNGASDRPGEVDSYTGRVMVEDAIAPVAWGIEFASITGGELHVIWGGGHEPDLREADETNRLLDDFLARVWPASLEEAEAREWRVDPMHARDDA